MKYVKRGGPEDGEVIDLKPQDWHQVAQRFELRKQKDESLIGVSPVYTYKYSSEYERHPCKKKGDTRILRWQKPNTEEMVLPAKMSDRAKLRPKGFEKMTPEERWQVDKLLGILDWDGSKDD